MVKPPSVLHKVTDGAGWNSEDLFGRLCLVVHAAFLHAGFHPHTTPAATMPWSLCHRYSVLPRMEQRRRDGTKTVELRLSRPWGRRRRRGGGHPHIELRAGVVTADGGRRNERRERLDPAALATILSGGVDDVARSLTISAPGSGAAGQWLWTLLVDKLCRCLFLCACEASGVPVEPGFASLHGDMKVAILEKLDDGKDLAMAECASKELRDLAAEHDRELWKAKYEAILTICPYPIRLHRPLTHGNTTLMSWKEGYAVMARRCKRLQQLGLGDPMFYHNVRAAVLLAERRRIHKEEDKVVRKAVAVNLADQRRKDDEEKSQRRSIDRSMTMAQKKWHGSGAVHSPSSRFLWKHR